MSAIDKVQVVGMLSSTTHYSSLAKTKHTFHQLMRSNDLHIKQVISELSNASATNCS